MATRVWLIGSNVGVIIAPNTNETTQKYLLNLLILIELIIFNFPNINIINGVWNINPIHPSKEIRMLI